MIKKHKSFILLVCAGVFAWLIFFSNKADAPNQAGENTGSDINNSQQNVDFDKSIFSIYDADSLWVVVNKQRPISLEYVPIDLVDVNVTKAADKSDEELMLRQEAASALQDLFKAANDENVSFLMGSAYRSSSLQTTYYNNYVELYGQEKADTFSARPGTSEHQTGLAADLSTADRNCYLEICFADTAEGKWLADNAHEFGFTIRYQEGKDHITGYQYEPWHIRYVGKELASELYNRKQVMEEFFELQN